MPEQADIEIPFIPIVCAAPLMLAYRRGTFEKNGLHVRLRPVPGWSAVRELIAHDRARVAHMLCPMPLASALGLDGKPPNARLCAVQNVNGGTLLLAQRHAHVRHINQMKGFVFGVPYPFSMQAYLLRDLLAKNGLDPRTDVRIQEIAPPRMPSSMEQGLLDGVLAPEPFGQIIVERGVGVVFAFSRDLYPGHPCCGIAATRAFIDGSPDLLAALLKSIVEAQRALHEASPKERRRIACELVDLGYWRAADRPAVENAMAGLLHDGRGGERDVPDHIDFIPHVKPAYGVWILAQMHRWGHIDAEPLHETIARDVFQGDAIRSIAEKAFPPGAPSLDCDLAARLDTEARAILGAPKTARDQTRDSALDSARDSARPCDALRARYDLSPSARARLGELLAEIAEVSAGQADLALAVTSSDEIGWLERTLNDVVKNIRFARDAADENAKLEAESREHRATIKAQKELIRELSTPVLPVLDGVLVAPIVGRIDAPRAHQIQEALLHAIAQQRATAVIVDVTGVPSLEASVVERLLSLVRSAALLGAECILVGVSPELAGALSAMNAPLPSLRTSRDLRSGIDLARRLAAR